MKKSMMAIFGTTIIVLSLLAPMMIKTGVAADPAAWYKTVTGVLNTDTYDLYPFATDASLKIGFSQYGEFINDLENVGLEYKEVDPFAPPNGSSIGSIVKSAWLNGWFCNVTYYHTIRSEQRCVWVSAQAGDPMGVTFGGSWIRVDYVDDKSPVYGYEDPRDSGYIIGNYAAGANNWGGRKTNGTAVTEPIQVLYDGPRLFVARLKTTIYDHFQYLVDSSSEDTPLLEVRFTILFNKVKKEVVVFKELKTLVPDKYADELKVQFSNRGEVDLGNEEHGYTSYFHFYTQGTSRGPDWVGPPPIQGQQGPRDYENNDTVAEGLPTVYDSSYVMNVTEDPHTTTNYNYTADGPYPQTGDATYDLAVAINPDAGYTWWAAFWPSLSDWTIDGWPMWWRSMQATDPHDIDSRTWEVHPRFEPTIPFYIGEWDVVLKPVEKKTPDGYPDMQQYRFVTIYGLTDLNDASDANMPGKRSNTPDSETMYLLDEYFNPWDLQSAVEKDETRWVDFKWHDGITTGWITDNKPVVDVPYEMWDQYHTFSERVIDLNTSELLYRRNGDYTFYVDDDGYGHFGDLLPNHDYKILYSTDTYYERTDPIDFTFFTSENVSEVGETVSLWDSEMSTFTDWLGVTHSAGFDDFDIHAALINDQNDFTATFTNELNGWETDFKVFKESEYTGSWDYQDIGNQTNQNVTLFYDLMDIHWDITPPFHLDTHVWFLGFTAELTTTISYNATEQEMNITATASLVAPYDYAGSDVLYSESIPGRYEWGVVGRDADSVDSAGLSNVAAAFKNKQVEYGLAGEDMFDPEIANQMPYVMSPITAGNTWANYYYGTSDYRTGLADDWCTTWPVSSSNMIGVGGPLANMLAYYGNDFMTAIYGLGSFTSYAPWQNQVVPVTCWNLQSDSNTYTSSNTVGYGVISTYLDLNGTVLFNLWGVWGRDTYYLTKWFHEEGIFQLQDAPSGVTSIVVKITYTSTSAGYKPTGFSIVEVLGTISERHWWHNSEHKGGIHDP